MCLSAKKRVISGARRLRGLFLIAVALIAGSHNFGYAAQAAGIKKVPGGYWKVDIDLENNSHFEVGRQYARKIVIALSDYEAVIDGFLRFNSAIAGLDLDTLKKRAQDIWPYIPVEYQDEILGMQSVFKYPTDDLGDGRLSRNELLIWQLLSDICRVPARSSASAVFGEGASTGKTIVARNVDKPESSSNEEVKALQAVVVIRNKNKSICGIGLLGDLSFFSAFNKDKVFAAVLDVETATQSALINGKRSCALDLRYALENKASLDAAASFMGNRHREYTYHHSILFADEDQAYFLENNIKNVARGLRRATTELKPGYPWKQAQAVAAINAFFALGTEDSPYPESARWESFSSLYDKFLADKGKISAGKMKEICGYAGVDGRAVSGAIFCSRDNSPTLYSVIVQMDTLEVWAYFAPEGEAPYYPNFIKVFGKNPFEE